MLPPPPIRIRLILGDRLLNGCSVVAKLATCFRLERVVGREALLCGLRRWRSKGGGASERTRHADRQATRMLPKTAIDVREQQMELLLRDGAARAVIARVLVRYEPRRRALDVVHGDDAVRAKRPQVLDVVDERQRHEPPRLQQNRHRTERSIEMPMPSIGSCCKIIVFCCNNVCDLKPKRMVDRCYWLAIRATTSASNASRLLRAKPRDITNMPAGQTDVGPWPPVRFAHARTPQLTLNAFVV